MVEGMLARIGTVTEACPVVPLLRLIRQLPASKNIRTGLPIAPNHRYPSQVCHTFIPFAVFLLQNSKSSPGRCLHLPHQPPASRLLLRWNSLSVSMVQSWYNWQFCFVACFMFHTIQWKHSQERFFYFGTSATSTTIISHHCVFPK